jgi:Trp operon repressor
MNTLELEQDKLNRDLSYRLGEAFAVLEDAKKAQTLFNLLLSPTEKERISKRLGILKELRKDTSYKNIKAAYNVSDNSIAQMSNALKEAPAEALRIIDRLVKEDLIQKGNDLRFQS